MPGNLEMMIFKVSKCDVSNGKPYFLRISNPQKQQFLMPSLAVAKHQPGKPEMKDSFLVNRNSCLMSEMKNEIIFCFLKTKKQSKQRKSTAELTKTTTNNKG